MKVWPQNFSRYGNVAIAPIGAQETWVEGFDAFVIFVANKS
jgi:hypothetical protein